MNSRKNDDRTLGVVAVIPQDIGRVLLNVINNACYALNQKRKHSQTAFDPTITVTTKHRNDQMEISILDNGPGITGLGLSISYDIVVNGHHGALMVENEVGRFTRFVIRIPIIETNSNHLS